MNSRVGVDGPVRKNRNVLGRVPGRVKECQRDIAEVEAVVVLHFAMIEFQASGRTGHHRDAAVRDFMRSRDEIGVDVRFDRRNDRGAGLTGRLGIDARVTSRIDDHGLPRSIAADQERALRQSIVKKPLEHGIKSSVCASRIIASAPAAVTAMSLAIVVAVVLAGSVAGCLGSYSALAAASSSFHF